MNLNYLKYTFSRYKYLYILLFILYTAVFTILSLFITNDSKPILLDIIYIPTIIYMIVAYVLPIWDFKPYYLKNLANIYFSLPDNRKNIYRTTTYMHLFLNVITYTSAISIGFLTLFLKGVDLGYGYLFLYLFYADLIFISVYFFQSFIASRCYTFKDAITISLAYMALPAFLMVVVYFGLQTETNVVDWTRISFIGSIDHVTKYFTQYAMSQFGQDFDNTISIIVALIITIFLQCLTLAKVKRLKPELVGEKTDSIFAYKLIGPIYLFLLVLLANYKIGFLALVIHIVLILAYIVYVLFSKRKLQINYYKIIMYVLFIIIANLIAYLV